MSLLHEFASDSDRLLWAGSLAARGETKLAARETALRAAGAKVPALAKAADLARATLDANEAEGPAALLQLASAAGQLRIAVLGAKHEGTPANIGGALDPAAPAGSPPHELYAILEALGSKKKPSDALLGIVDSEQTAKDPRLWPALVAGFRHPYMRDAVVAAVGRIGSPLLPILESQLKLKGKEDDAARLAAIARIRGAEAETLYRRAVEEGSQPVRLVGLGALARCSREKFEELALQAVRKKPDEAGLLAMVAPHAHGELLEAVLAAFEKSSWSTRSVLDSLLGKADDAHPIAFGQEAAGSVCTDEARYAELLPILARRPVTDHVALARHAELWRAVLAYRLPGALEFVVRFLSSDLASDRGIAAQVLSEASDPASREAAVEAALRDPDVAVHGARALLSFGEEVALERLRSHYEAYLPTSAPADATRPGLWGKVKGIFGAGPKAVEESPTTATDPGPPSALLTATLGQLTSESDRRWVPIAIALAPRAVTAAIALGELKDPAGLEPLIEAARKEPRHVHKLLTAIGSIGGPRAVRFLCETLGPATNIDVLTGAVRGLGAARDPTAIAVIEEKLARTKDTMFAAAAGQVLTGLKGLAAQRGDA